MEKLRIVSIIVQDGQGGIEAVSKLNYDARVLPINSIPKSGFASSQYGILLKPFRVASILKHNDILITNLPIHHMYFWLLNLIFRKKHIAVEHGPWILVLGWKAPILVNWIYQLWLKRARTQFVLVAKDLFALYNLVRTNNVYIPNAVASVRCPTCNPSNELTTKFVFVGRFDVQKDVRLALEAFLEFSNTSERSCSFDLFGSGAELALLKEEFVSFNNIRFRGYDSNIGDKLHEYDVCLVTSWFEGLPGVVLEALSAGLKVVCTPFISGLMEVASFPSVTITDSRNPVDIAHAINASVEPARYQLLVSNEVRSRYSVKSVRFMYQELFESVTKGPINRS